MLACECRCLFDECYPQTHGQTEMWIVMRETCTRCHERQTNFNPNTAQVLILVPQFPQTFPFLLLFFFFFFLPSVVLFAAHSYARRLTHEAWLSCGLQHARFNYDANEWRSPWGMVATATANVPLSGQLGTNWMAVAQTASIVLGIYSGGMQNNPIIHWGDVTVQMIILDKIIIIM